MNLYANIEYKNDIEWVADLALPWDKLKNKSILISGASGLIGSFLIDVILKKNSEGFNCTVYALGRSKKRMESRFSYYKNREDLRFIEHDINFPLPEEKIDTTDYVLHLASNTHPIAYATDPIGTITTNIIGAMNMLDFAVVHNAIRCVYASSNEVYGENRGDVEKFSEQYCGYIDSNTLRAGYPESKRCGEALCQAYIKQRNLDIVIPRLTRSYGPTLLESDTKALSQFLHNAVQGKNIILKSTGNQYYSYLYVADTVSGLLTVLLCGESGMAYNIADERSDITLKNLAEYIADISNVKVEFEIPDSLEASGYSKATKARLDSTKLKKLGWSARYDIEEGLKRTLNMLSL